jgi:hypothetical protein
MKFSAKEVNLWHNNAAQQSVQPTGGILRRFRAFFWLRAFPAPKPNPRPPTSG